MDRHFRIFWIGMMLLFICCCAACILIGKALQATADQRYKANIVTQKDGVITNADCIVTTGMPQAPVGYYWVLEKGLGK